jgi:hypothetical protein
MPRRFVGSNLGVSRRERERGDVVRERGGSARGECECECENKRVWRTKGEVQSVREERKEERQKRQSGFLVPLHKGEKKGNNCKLDMVPWVEPWTRSPIAGPIPLGHLCTCQPIGGIGSEGITVESVCMWSCRQRQHTDAIFIPHTKNPCYMALGQRVRMHEMKTCMRASTWDNILRDCLLSLVVHYVPERMSELEITSRRRI